MLPHFQASSRLTALDACANEWIDGAQTAHAFHGMSAWRGKFVHMKKNEGMGGKAEWVEPTIYCASLMSLYGSSSAPHNLTASTQIGRT